MRFQQHSVWYIVDLTACIATLAGLVGRSDLRTGMSLISLVRAGIVRGVLQQGRSLSTTPVARGLEEFFDRPRKEGEKVTAGEGRGSCSCKSRVDIHFVLHFFMVRRSARSGHGRIPYFSMPAQGEPGRRLTCAPSPGTTCTSCGMCCSRSATCSSRRRTAAGPPAPSCPTGTA